MFNQEELRRRPTYNELIQEIEEDVRIVLPDRRANFLRDSPRPNFQISIILIAPRLPTSPFSDEVAG